MPGHSCGIVSICLMVLLYISPVTAGVKTASPGERHVSLGFPGGGGFDASVHSTAGGALGVSGRSGVAQAQVLPVRKRRDDFSLGLSKARRMMVSGDYEGAIGILERLVAERPEIMAASEMLAVSYVRAGRAARAIEFIKKKLEDYPGSFSLIKNLGLAYLELGDRRGAVGAWRRLISGNGNKNRAVYYGVVSKLERENGLYDEAVETLREGLAFEDYRSRYTRELVSLLRAMGREKEAFLEAFRAVVLYEDDWGWGRLRDAREIFVASKKRGSLLETADSLVSVDGGGRPAPSIAYALLLAEDGRYDSAFGEIRDAAAKNDARLPLYSFLELFAGGRDGGWSREEDEFFDRVLKLFSKKFPGARESGGILLLRAKMERERALKDHAPERFERVLELTDELIRDARYGDFNFKSRLLKAGVLIEDLHRFEDGLRVLEGARWPSRGDSLVASELVSKALIGVGDWDRGDRFFRNLKKAGDSTFVVLASFEEGLSLFYRGMYDEALKTLSDLAKRYPWSRWANDALELSIMIKKAENSGDTRGLDLYRKSLLLDFRGRYGEALDTLEVIWKTRQGSFLAPHALMLRADICGRISRPRDEEESLRRVAESYPQSVLAPVSLERLAELAGGEEALKLYGAILDRYPDYPFVGRVRKRFMEIRGRGGIGGGNPGGGEER